jgi:Predicted Zn-dependent peptidases
MSYSAKLLAVLLSAAIAAPALANVPASARRERPAGRAPDTATTTKFEVAGIPVILRRNTANEVVVANVYLLGGARQLTPANAGIEAMLLAASERGTRHFPGAVLRQRTAQLGSTIEIAASDDWSVIGLRAIRSTFDSTWALLADRLMAPTLDPAEVAIVREQFVSGARQRGTEPDDAASELADSLLNIGTPYATPSTGTVESLSRLTAAQLRQYETTQIVTSRMLVVVVGNVERAQVERLVRNSLGTLPRGSYQWTAPPRCRCWAPRPPSTNVRCRRTICSDTYPGQPRRAPTTPRFASPPRCSPAGCSRRYAHVAT